MPNTPASIGVGMTALAGDDVNTDLGRAIQALFEAVGEVAVVSEADLDSLRRTIWCRSWLYVRHS